MSMSISKNPVMSLRDGLNKLPEKIQKITAGQMTKNDESQRLHEKIDASMISTQQFYLLQKQ